MLKILKISLLMALLLMLSGCAALQALGMMGGQSGGTRIDPKTQIAKDINNTGLKAGDEITVDKTDAFVINNLNRYAPITTIATVSLFLLFLLALAWLKRSPADKQRIKGMEYAIASNEKMIKYFEEQFRKGTPK